MLSVKLGLRGAWPPRPRRPRRLADSSVRTRLTACAPAGGRVSAKLKAASNSDGTVRRFMAVRCRSAHGSFSELGASLLLGHVDPVPVRGRTFDAEMPAAFGEHPARSVVGASVEDRERVVEAAREVCRE